MGIRLKKDASLEPAGSIWLIKFHFQDYNLKKKNSILLNDRANLFLPFGQNCC